MDEAIDVALEVISKNIREPFGGEASGASSSGEGEGSGSGSGAGGGGAAAGGRGAGRSLPLAKLVPHVASAASDVLAAPTDEPKPVCSAARLPARSARPSQRDARHAPSRLPLSWRPPPHHGPQGSKGSRGVAAALGKLHMLDSFCADLFSSV